jgi:hypothetical protein
MATIIGGRSFPISFLSVVLDATAECAACLAEFLGEMSFSSRSEFCFEKILGGGPDSGEGHAGDL